MLFTQTGKTLRNPSLIFIILCSFLLFGNQQDGSRNFKTDEDGSTTWRSIGPSGGNVRVLAFNPNNQDEIFAGIFHQASIFKTEDAGQVWQRLAYQEGTGGLTGFAVDPTNPDKMYVSIDRLIYISQDGGASWQYYYYPDNYMADVNHSGEMVVDPNNPDILYVVGYYCEGYYQTDPSCMAVIKSVDGGENWTGAKINYGSDHGSVYSIAVHPVDSNTIYVLGNFVDGLNSYYKVYRSTDGGSTWVGISGDSILDVRFSQHFNSSIIIDSTNPLNIYVGTELGIWRSNDGGLIWDKNQGQAFAHKLAINPSSPNVIYAGHNNIVYISEDGGLNWTPYSSGVNGRCTSLLAASSQTQSRDMNSVRLYYGSDSGVYKSIDGGLSWQESHQGLNATTISAVACTPSTLSGESSSSLNTILYAVAYGDGFYKSMDLGQSWIRIPDFLHCDKISKIIINPQNPNEIIILITGTCSGSYIHRSVDGGETWQQLANNKIKDIALLFGTASSMEGESLDLIYAAGWGYDISGTSMIFFKSTDGGQNWISSKVTEINGYGTAIAVDPNDSNIIYFAGEYRDSSTGLSAIALFRSTDGGHSWIELHGDFSSDIQIKAIAVDPSSSNKVYLGTLRGVHRSEDWGLSWISPEPSFVLYCMKLRSYPISAFHSLQYSDLDSWTEIFYGAYNGVFHSEDGGITWEEMNAGLSFREVKSLDVGSDRAFALAGTSSGGVWIKALREYTLTIASNAGGITNPEPGGYSYGIGARVSITAVPDEGYDFLSWSGNVPSGQEMDNPLVLNMDSDKSIAANFEYACARLGDVNEDENITPSDAQMAFDIYLELIVPDYCQRVTSDVNCDALTTPVDAQWIFEHYLRLRELPLTCLEAMGSEGKIFQTKGIQNIIRMGDRQKGPEGQLVIPVFVNNAAGIKSFGFDVQYDLEILEFIGVRRTAMTRYCVDVDSNVIADGIVRVGGYGALKSFDRGELLVELIFRQKNMQRKGNIRILRWE